MFRVFFDNLDVVEVVRANDYPNSEKEKKCKQLSEVLNHFKTSVTQDPHVMNTGITL